MLRQLQASQQSYTKPNQCLQHPHPWCHESQAPVQFWEDGNCRENLVLEWISSGGPLPSTCHIPTRSIKRKILLKLMPPMPPKQYWASTTKELNRYSLVEANSRNSVTLWFFRKYSRDSKNICWQEETEDGGGEGMVGGWEEERERTLKKNHFK